MLTKAIDIRNQKRLSLMRIYGLAVTGIRYRMFRAAVTMAVITLAIAFMMNVITEGVATKQVAGHVETRIAEQRAALSWASRIGSVPSTEGLLLETASLTKGEPRWAETQSFLNLENETMDSLVSRARAFSEHLQFFRSLDFAKHRLLFHRTRGNEIFERLREPSGWERFTSERALMKSVRFPTPLHALESDLGAWPEFRLHLERLQIKRAEAVKSVDAHLGSTRPLEALIGMDGEFGNFLAEIGFRFDEEEARAVASKAEMETQTARLARMFSDTVVKQQSAAHLNKTRSEVKDSLMWQMLSSESEARWFLQMVENAGIAPEGLDAEQVSQISRRMLLLRRLDAAGNKVEEVGGGFLGMGVRMSWLMFLALLVCGVGITNAMLMSVTERFQEIATLKCLGALNGFVMILFVIEASLLGLLGALLGAAVGSILGFGRMWIRFGEFFWNSFTFSSWSVSLVIAVFVGMGLAALAAVYPSWVAARLAPMEAMRIE